jgi:BirA family transcriptional regulator, biotin operon repressor / biotin---[acetyl-CoA-carboxylase] ligase
MNVIKLSAIDSTNSYLKRMMSEISLDNFTFVIAENQTAGKGQLGTNWVAEAGKNLTFSMLYCFELKDNKDIFLLNSITALSVLDTLKFFKIPDLSIKWPNDILSGNKKISGMLIENNFKTSKSIQSIIGVGLNVNQDDFSHLPQASSMKLINDYSFDKEEVFSHLANELVANFKLFTTDKERFWVTYLDNLFRFGEVSEFQDKEGVVFTAKIIGVTDNGLLITEDSNKISRTFEVKEIKMVY